MKSILIAVIILIIFIIIIIIAYACNYTNKNTNKINCNNFKKHKKNNFKKSKKSNQPNIPNGCYEPIWSVNSVGYELTNFPSIEVYSYLSYNNNLMNTDPQNIPWNFGEFTQTN